jgi:cytochrome P450
MQTCTITVEVASAIFEPVFEIATDHFAFGHGMRFCVGVHVARLEGRVMIEELLARIPDYEIDESQARRVASDFQLGWMEIPLVVG